MRILVIEDKALNQDSARETLAGHEVTIVSSFDAAMEIMSEKIDEENAQRLLVEAGFPTRPTPPSQPEVEGVRERWMAYWDAKKAAEAQSVIPFPFEVVLADMMMPMSRESLAPGLFNPKEQVPYGFVLALRAALSGAKFVAMVTDTNHHHGAMSASLDHLGSAYYYAGFKPNFTINGAKVMFVHAPFVTDIAVGASCYNCLGGAACGYCRTPLVQGECRNCKFRGRKPEPCNVCHGEGKHDKAVYERKDWGQVLADLTAG